MPSDSPSNITTAKFGSHPFLIANAMSDATKPMTDPIDKSMPPVMITNATPIPMIAYKLDHLMRFCML